MGVNTVTWKAVRKNPKAKKTTFLYEAEKIRFEIPIIVNEVLLVNRKEQILEGLSSNFFAIHKGEIWTEGRQVLSGRTRAIILDVAATAGIRIHLAPIYISEIPNLEEAFLTSASRSVLPIQKINDCLVGTGKAGDVTNKLNVLYRQRI
jgi:branched-chain amino acid aminotransferase